MPRTSQGQTGALVELDRGSGISPSRFWSLIQQIDVALEVGACKSLWSEKDPSFKALAERFVKILVPGLQI